MEELVSFLVKHFIKDINGFSNLSNNEWITILYPLVLLIKFSIKWTVLTIPVWLPLKLIFQTNKK